MTTRRTNSPVIRTRFHTCVAAIGASLAALLFLSGCSTIPVSKEMIVPSRNATLDRPQHLSVFFDGTRNDPQSETNVWELKKAIDGYDGNGRSIYIEGVGSAETPILGSALGVGMEKRILRGYRFLSMTYRPNDKIFIFGFSRGAHEARALAGLIAYAGLLETKDMSDGKIISKGNKVLEMVKDYSDEDMRQAFVQSPSVHPLASRAKNRIKRPTRPAVVEFLGIWDTVPGSSFKEYGACSEKPDGRTGERYKTGSYPSIKRIAHAVALDEKRDKFSPILLCPAMRPDLTTVKEIWFSGAHADVGGGYPNGKMHFTSLSWMVSEVAPFLDARLVVPPESTHIESSHWSIGDSPANLFSNCQDRKKPESSDIHASALARMKLATAPIEVKGKVQQEAPNPPRCNNITER